MDINLDEVQPYKDKKTMSREELIEYISKPYRTKKGIIIAKKFNENGEDFNTLIQNYYLKCLEGGV